MRNQTKGRRLLSSVKRSHLFIVDGYIIHYLKKHQQNGSSIYAVSPVLFICMTAKCLFCYFDIKVIANTICHLSSAIECTSGFSSRGPAYALAPSLAHSPFNCCLFTYTHVYVICHAPMTSLPQNYKAVSTRRFHGTASITISMSLSGSHGVA